MALNMLRGPVGVPAVLHAPADLSQGHQMVQMGHALAHSKPLLRLWELRPGGGADFPGHVSRQLIGPRAGVAAHGLQSFLQTAGVVALVSVLCVWMLELAGLFCDADKVIIGGIVSLMPGIALTNGIRDVANCDYLSGTIRAIDAVLIAAGIALGVGLVLRFAALIPGVHI